MHKEINRHFYYFFFLRIKLIEYMPDGEKLSSLINAHLVPLLNNNQIVLLAYYYLKSLEKRNTQDIYIYQHSDGLVGKIPD